MSYVFTLLMSHVQVSVCDMCGHCQLNEAPERGTVITIARAAKLDPRTKEFKVAVF